MSDSPNPDASSESIGTASPAGVNPSAVESLLDEAQQALSSIEEPTAALPPGVRPFEFNDLVGSAAVNEPATLELLRDVQLDLKIELGRTHMYLEDVLRLKEGAVVTLDKLAGDPVDIYANGRLIARGEVLVLNDNFCVRVAELIAGDEAA
jgi:flagellar motor switch protein FliN/FliY